MTTDGRLWCLAVASSVALIGCSVTMEDSTGSIAPLPTTGIVTTTAVSVPAFSTIALDESIERLNALREQADAYAESQYMREIAVELEGIDPNMGDEQLLQTGLYWCIRMQSGMNATNLMRTIADEFSGDAAAVNIAAAVAGSRSLCPDQGYRFNP